MSEQLQQAVQGLGWGCPLVSYCHTSCQWELAAVSEQSTSFQEGKQAVSRLDAQERHVRSQKRQLFKVQGPPGPTGLGCTLNRWLLIYKAAALRLQRAGFLSLSVASL